MEMEMAQLRSLRPKQDNLPEQAAEMIAGMIREQHMTAGDRIPNEFELGAKLQVGRGTIREAVKLLVSRHVLEVRRGVGTFVASQTGQIEDPLGFAYCPDRKRLMQDLLEVRMQMEPWMARTAAWRASEEDLVQLRSACRQVEEDILSGRDCLAHDAAFHGAIAACTGNLVLPGLVPVLSWSAEFFGALMGKGALSDIIVSHRAIADAVCAHNEELAEQKMIEHLEQTRQELARQIAVLEKQA